MLRCIRVRYLVGTGALLLVYVYIYRHIAQDDSVSYFLYRKLSGYDPVLNKAGNSTVRPDQCASCFDQQFNYILKADRACGSNQRDFGSENRGVKIDVLILVASEPSSYARRLAIRDTWGSVAVNNSANVRVVFLCGKSQVAPDDLYLRKESVKYKDILQADFVESYQHLTLKTIMGVRWVTQECAAAKYVVKTDDDVWLNVPALLNRLKTGNLENSLGGHCYFGEYPRRLNQNSKWFLSYQDYPHDVYPDYCAGVGYVMSMQVARGISRVSKDTPFFVFEDVYIGLCAAKLRFLVKSLPGFRTDRPRVDICEMKMDHIVTSHPWSSDGFRDIWNNHADCSCPSYCTQYWIYIITLSIILLVAVLVIVFWHHGYEKWSLSRTPWSIV